MSRCSGHDHSQSELDHHANQMNPNNDAYQDRMDNHSNQLNPNHDLGPGMPVESESLIILDQRFHQWIFVEISTVLHHLS